LPECYPASEVVVPHQFCPCSSIGSNGGAGESFSLPFPRESSRYLERDVPFHKALTREERKRLEGIARILTEEKNWEGCGGLTMDEEIKLNISAQAALLILKTTITINHDPYFLPSVVAGKASVRNGDAGRPALFQRLTTG